MKTISISNIVIPDNRQRREFLPTKMQELVESIKSKGLMHPVVLRNDGKTLVAGERRLRAIETLWQLNERPLCEGIPVPRDEIPYVLLGDLPEDLVKEAELEENIIRADITWQEKAEAIYELSKLRERQAKSQNKDFKVADLREEITGKRQGNDAIPQALILAKNMDIPEVAKAKDQKTALKALRKHKEHELKVERLKDFKTLSDRYELREGDFRNAFPLDKAQDLFDCLIIDPPYGVGADTFSDQSKIKHKYKDDRESAMALYKEIFKYAHAYSKPQAHAFVFMDILNFQELLTHAMLSGWRVWYKPLIWAKLNGKLPDSNRGPKLTYETIMLLSKGDKYVRKVFSDVLFHPLETKRDHGAQKPVSLYAELIEISCVPNDVIGDFCAGSGTIFEAGHKTSCRVIASEEETKSIELCKLRIQKNTGG